VYLQEEEVVTMQKTCGKSAYFVSIFQVARINNPFFFVHNPNASL